MENKTIYTFHRFPSRSESAGILKELIESGVLNDDMVENLKEIKTCIENERQGIDLFGAAHDNVAPLFVNMRPPEARDNEEYFALYKSHNDKVRAIRERYHMVPRLDPLLITGKPIGDAVDECEVTEQEAWA